ncbi:MAG TPA: site-2 protease family protein [Verrucomicrobiae bacterium]
MPTQRGSVKLFRLLGIDVYLHWAWFVAFIYLTSRPHAYSNYGWSALEILSLFLIVLTHEFGHALACRSVGGTANLIVLWPLGGVAYVNPPQRPGAQLWSIAAGPLVNVVLFPIFFGLYYFGKHHGWPENHHDAYLLVRSVAIINTVLLVFNLMPVYPLDGGQILRSLLWFLFGRANSLMAASVIGLIGAAGFATLIIWALLSPDTDKSNLIWLGIMAAFILMNCWGGLKQAQALAKLAKIPRRPGFACPSCKTAPPLGALWRCGQCGNAFDTFATNAACPQCGANYNLTQCLDCGTRSVLAEWQKPVG